MLKEQDLARAQHGEQLAAQKLRMHFERTPLAVVEWDRMLRITAWNPAAEAIFGFPLYEALGKTVPQLLSSEFERENADAMCHELLEVSEGNKHTLVNITRAGRTIHCEWYNSSLLDEWEALSDPDHKVMQQYGAYGEKTLYGKKTVGVIRSTVFYVRASRNHSAFPTSPRPTTSTGGSGPTASAGRPSPPRATKVR